MKKQWYNIYIKRNGDIKEELELICKIKSKGLMYLLREKLKEVYPESKFELIIK